MRRLMVVAVLLLCLPMVGEGQSIRYHPDLSTLTLGKPTSASIRFHPAIASGSTLLTGLVSYWPLDEESGTRYDAVGGNDLTDNNTVGFDTGVDGAAASFVAANSESLSKSSYGGLAGKTDWTVSFWWKPVVQNAASPLVACLYNTWANEIVFALRQLSHPTVVYGDIITSDGTNYANTPFNYYPTPDVWHLVTITGEGTVVTLEFDLNGTTSVATLAAPIYSTAATLGFNRDYALGYANMQIDEPAIWDRVLTSDERAELYNAGAGKFYPF